MVFHVDEEVQFISMTRYFKDYLKFSKSLKVELGGGSDGLDVSAEEPTVIFYFV